MMNPCAMPCCGSFDGENKAYIANRKYPSEGPRLQCSSTYLLFANRGNPFIPRSINLCLVVLMNRRTATFIVCIVDAAMWAFVVFASLTSQSDAATKGLDQGAGLIVTALFLFTGAPALALTLLRRAPIVALTLALAFPAAFAAVFIAAVIAFTHGVH
jgi:hypothetical protein